jgi:hypothetical protein
MVLLSPSKDDTEQIRVAEICDSHFSLVTRCPVELL